MNDTNPKAQVAGVFGRSAPTYDTVIPFFATFAERLVDRAAVQPGERVLDVACGTGACSSAVVAAGARVVAGDLAVPMVAELRRRAGSVAAVAMDAEALACRDGAFDAAVCGFGVFFLPDHARALAEVRRVLRPGGRFAASTFTDGRAGFVWFFELGRHFFPDDPPPPRHPLVLAAGLKEALGAAGFRDADTVSTVARFVFADADAVVAWGWSHGGRALLERLDETQLAELRERVAEQLDLHHACPGGGYELVQAVELTIAYA